MQVRALLTIADYYGTLAAARSLGRSGVPVTIADPKRCSTANWSKFATERLVSPAVEDGERFIEWLIALGKRDTKYALLPTSDDSAWLFSKYRGELERDFYLIQPPVDELYKLLNKCFLHQLCIECNVPVPKTWFPRSALDLESVLSEAVYPLMVKPRTQVLFPSRNKGTKVATDTELKDAFRRIGAMAHKPLLERYDHDASVPIIQEFFADASEGIYNLSGFVSRDGQLSGLRAGIKVLQRPRRIGIGLCFEEAAIDEATAASIKRLVTKAGFVGVFEAEFIRTSHGNLLIDFNPRFYNQMAFDLDRGLPLAELAYYEAIGNDARVQSLISQSLKETANPTRVYSHRFLLEITLGLQGLSGALSKSEVKHWRDWIREHQGRTTDAVFDASDIAPSILDSLQHLYGYARHPRATIRSLLLNRQ